MSKLMKTEHGDTLRKQSGIEESPHSSELIEKTEIPGTPFTLVQTLGEIFVSLGRYKISPNMKSIEDGLDYVQYNMYEIVLKMIAIVIEFEKNENKTEKI